MKRETYNGENTDYYEVTLDSISNKKAYLMLRSKLGEEKNVEEGVSYIIDKIKV